ncbi:type IV pilus assembly protein PilM [bacterium]|nr:type IV pilus assembly protein PilM [bacterium]
MLKLKLKTKVALDLGTNYVKVVKMKETIKGTQLIKAGMVSVKGAETKELRDVRRAEAIREVLEKTKIRPGEVSIVGIWCSPIIRDIKLPKLPEAKLRKVLRYEIEKYIPFRVKDVVWDFQVLSEVIEGKLKKVNILLIAVKKEVIDRYLKLIHRAGVYPKVIDVDPLASVNSPLTDNLTEEKITVLIDHGARNTTLNILKGRVLEFARSIPIAGNALTMALVEGLKIGFDEAERLKCKKADALLEEAEETKEGNEYSSQKVSEIIRPTLEELVSEIEKSFRYYKTNFEVEKIDEIILCGGGTRLKSIDKFFVQRLKVEVRIGNPLINIQIAPEIDREYLKDISPSLAGAIGLARRNLIRISIFPRELLKIQRVEQGRRIYRIVAIGLTAFLLLCFTTRLIQGLVSKHRINKMERAKRGMGSTALEVEKLKAQDKKAQEKITLIKRITSHQSLWSPVIYEISKLTPQEVWLTSFATVQREGRGEMLFVELDEKVARKLKLKGVAPSHQAIIQFMTNLESSPLFHKVAITSTQEKEEFLGGIEFEIDCSLTPGR